MPRTIPPSRVHEVLPLLGDNVRAARIASESLIYLTDDAAAPALAVMAGEHG